MFNLYLKYILGMNWIKIKNGKNNRIQVSSNAKLRKNKIKVSGDENRLIVGDKALLRGCNISIKGKSNALIIDDNVTLVNLHIIFDNDGQIIKIGKNTNMAKGMLVSLEKYPIIIGEDCNISYDVEIRNTDSHMIFDKLTGKRINYGGEVIIENHVWIGTRSMILKNSCIKSGSIIGANSLVSGIVPNNVIAAGIPVREIRKQVKWTRDEVMERENGKSICTHS